MYCTCTGTYLTAVESNEEVIGDSKSDIPVVVVHLLAVI